MLIHRETYSTHLERKEFLTALKRICAGDVGLATTGNFQILAFPSGDPFSYGYIALEDTPVGLDHHCGSVLRTTSGAALDFIAEIVGRLLTERAARLPADPLAILKAGDAAAPCGLPANPHARALAARFLRAFDFAAYRATLRSHRSGARSGPLDYKRLRAMEQPRRDVIRHWPWLSHLALAAAPGPLTEGAANFAARILLKEQEGHDGEKTKALAVLLDRLRGLDPDDDIDALIWDALPALADLPREWLPGRLCSSTAGEWSAALRVASETKRLASLTDRRPRSFVKHFPGSWTAIENDVVVAGGARGYGFDPDEDFHLLCEHCGDMLSAFERQVLLPSFARIGHDVGDRPIWFDALAPDPAFVDPKGTIRQMSAKLLLRDKGWRGIALLASAWRARTEELGIREAQLSIGAKWRVPFEEIRYDTPTGRILIRALSTPGELVDEGTRGLDSEGIDGLSHCAPTFMSECAAGQSLMLSIRLLRAGGPAIRLSTVLLRPRYANGEYVLRVVQHRGLGNGPAPAAATAALDWLLSEPRSSAFALQLAETRHPHDAVFLYDPARPGAIERLLNGWYFALPRELRGRGPEEIAAAAIHGAVPAEAGPGLTFAAA